jgi:uncharacterized membrane protein
VRFVAITGGIDLIGRRPLIPHTEIVAIDDHPLRWHDERSPTMNKILVAVFGTETAAFEGLTALKELHRDGDITLYASTVVSKDADGKVSEHDQRPQGPIGTLVGVIAGGLIGVVGGPAGVALGAYVGGAGGLMYDMFTAGVTLDFVEEASAALTPGKTAIVADVDETWVTPIDTRLTALGAVTYRHVPDELIDEQISRDAETASAEIEHLRSELRQSSAETKATVEAALERQKAKLDGLIERIDSTMKRHQSEFESKVAALRAQLAHARDKKRQQVDARIAELETAHEARQQKLSNARDLAKQSRELAKQSLAATVEAVKV